MRRDEDDVSLVLSARGGDADAFAMLLARHRPTLLALCQRTLGDSVLAEDAAQEASLKALLNLDRLDQADRFGPWLVGIGLNVCRMWTRARGHDNWSWDALSKAAESYEHTSVKGGVTAGRLMPLAAFSNDPETQVTDADLSVDVRRAVAALPCGQQAAVTLFYLSGLSYKETAATLGIEQGAVKTRLHKARGTLRGRLRALGQEENIVMTTAKQTVEMGEQMPEHICSFCGKKNQEIHRMISGPPPLHAIICNECVALCNQILADEEAKATAQ